MSFKIAVGLTLIVVGLLNSRAKKNSLIPGILMGIVFIFVGITASSFYYDSPLNFDIDSIIPNAILGFGIGLFSSSFYKSQPSDKFQILKKINHKRILLPLFFLVLFYFLNLIPNFSGFLALLIVTGGFFIQVSILEKSLFKKGLNIGVSVLIIAFIVSAFFPAELVIPRNDTQIIDLLSIKILTLNLEHIFFYFYHGASIGVFWDFVTGTNSKV